MDEHVLHNYDRKLKISRTFETRVSVILTMHVQPLADLAII